MLKETEQRLLGETSAIYIVQATPCIYWVYRLNTANELRVITVPYIYTDKDDYEKPQDEPYPYQIKSGKYRGAFRLNGYGYNKSLEIARVLKPLAPQAKFYNMLLGYHAAYMEL